MREALFARFSRKSQLSLVLLFLLALPLCVYWNTIWTEYGLRDDYSVAREAREEPATIIKFCGSHARPVYGWLLKTTFTHIVYVRDISRARMMGAAFLGLVSAGTCAVLALMFGWSLVTAACVGALLALVPTAQVIASWGILWAYSVSALLSMSAFVIAEHGFRRNAGARAKQLGLIVVAGLLLVASAWNYQPVSLFYLVFVAVIVVRRGQWTERASRTRLFLHLLLLGASLLAAYVLIRISFEAGWLPMSKRIAFDLNPLGKLVWFARNVVPNALALLVINDHLGRTAPYYQIAATSMGLLLITGGCLVGKRRGWRESVFWFSSLIVLSVGAYSINIIASERWSSYRTIYPLIGVVVVFLAASMEVFGEAVPLLKRLRHYLGLAVALVAAFLARQQSYELIAVPQNKEYRLVGQEAKKLDLTRDQRVYVITPTPLLAPAPLLYADEFGSLSTDSDWVPKEIIKLIVHEKYPALDKCRSMDHMVSGEAPPPPGIYDVVLDLRPLREVTK